jgi:hypothetical protein
MERRNFLGSLGALGLAAPSQAQDKKTRFYLLHHFYLKNGTQKARIDEYFTKGLLPALNKVHDGPKIFLEGLVAPHLPQVVFILGHRSWEEVRDVQSNLRKDSSFGPAFEAWERGDEPPYEQMSTALLEAARYSPEVVPLNPAPKTPRIFELRVYHSPTFRQLGALHERFAGPEIKIFNRSGVHPILYTSTVIGPNSPNLTYLIPFEDLAARDKAWTAFGADPEWVKVRKESVDRSGQISINSQISLYRAAAYSPVR